MVQHSFGHVICVLVVIRGLSCCSNPGTVGLDVKTRYSDVIISGTISAKLGDGKYQMSVDCVLKDSGADIPASLNISGVETGEGGMCFVSEISVGTKWVVFLSEYYNMRYKEQAFGDYTDIVQKGCDLRVKSTTPVGVVSTTCLEVVYRACPRPTQSVVTRRTKRPRTSTTTTSTTTTTAGSQGGSVHSGPPPGHGMGSAGSHTSPNTPPKCGMGCENRSPSFIPSSGLVLLTLVIFIHFWT
uniref:Uncharacterized protein LOC111128528 n=1 Tax=Crassostrea virginica TaxID=6565 RepID=A0A8B8DSB0_CRAVI|nr:uncharacterized protein LOC111128528 [Crassostrea virginica]XP_022329872.1 uncharacterized protein LOC111128528 [Crassostrea virginica]